MVIRELAEYKGAARFTGNEYCFTTGQFAKIDRSYRRHCGPTAVTNLLFTLARMEGRTLTEKPEEVFRKVAGIGGRRLLYVNTDLFKRFGGTSDLLAPLYIGICLRRYGLDGYRIRGPFPATARRICTELDRGAILYMEVHRHPVYGNHHMLCYGYQIRDGKLFLRMADGWVGRVHDLPAGEGTWRGYVSRTRRAAWPRGAGGRRRRG